MIEIQIHHASRKGTKLGVQLYMTSHDSFPETVTTITHQWKQTKTCQLKFFVLNCSEKKTKENLLEKKYILPISRNNKRDEKRWKKNPWKEKILEKKLIKFPHKKTHKFFFFFFFLRKIFSKILEKMSQIFFS